MPTRDGGFWLVPSGEQQCPLGLMSLYWSQQPLLSKMNYRSPHSSESVICAQPAGQSSLLVAVVMDVNFHCSLLAPNSPGFTTQNNALKSFILLPRTCKLHNRTPPPPLTLCLLYYFIGLHCATRGQVKLCADWKQQGQHGVWSWSLYFSYFQSMLFSSLSRSSVNWFKRKPKKKKKKKWMQSKPSYFLPPSTPPKKSMYPPRARF